MYRIGKEEIDAVSRVIETRSMFKINDSLQESKNVEESIKTIFNTEYPIFMTSGHAALTSALIAMGIGPGDEVIVPAYTYIATAMAVVASGAVPIIAEIDESLTLSPEDAEKKITKNTKAIIPVHIQGFPCKMDEIMSIAKKYNLMVLEDACQADGGSYKNKRLGTIGDAGALSFNYFKVISCGEGGALLTDNKEIFERSLIYHDSSAIAYFGDQLKGFDNHTFCGQEFRSNELCAAVLRVQLTRLDGILADNRKNKKYIADAISHLCDIVESNDIDGDCATTLAIRFDSAEDAQKFATSEGINGVIPINTGKHIYSNWTPIMEKKGAFNPLMDPFKMEANKNIVPDYSTDMCPQTLDILSKVVYININPDYQTEKLDKIICNIKNALKS